MRTSKLHYLFGIAVVCLIALPLHAQAKPAKGKTDKAAQPAEKAKLVLMPLRVPEEDKNLTGAMETALVEGLQQKYAVFSGEQVAQKAHEIFMRESRNTAHKECDETKCMQNIAMAFQAELIATANVTKQDGIYYLALSVQNIFDNKVEYSKSLTCKNCDGSQVVDKLKELSGTVTPVAAAPIAEAPQAKINQNDPESALWNEVKTTNTIDDYQTYLTQYPKGKYIALAKNHIRKLQEEAVNEASRKEQQEWDAAEKANTENNYQSYLNDYPQGRYIGLAQVRIRKLQADAAAKQQEAARQRAEAEKAQQELASQNHARPAELPKGFVSQGGRIWMPTTFIKTWSDANAYCNNTAINGQSGWRLPTKDELQALYDSGAMKGQGWTLSYTWSSTSAGSGVHYNIGLDNGYVYSFIDTSPSPVTCVY